MTPAIMPHFQPLTLDSCSQVTFLSAVIIHGQVTDPPLRHAFRANHEIHRRDRPRAGVTPTTAKVQGEFGDSPPRLEDKQEDDAHFNIVISFRGVNHPVDATFALEWISSMKQTLSFLHPILRELSLLFL